MTSAPQTNIRVAIPAGAPGAVPPPGSPRPSAPGVQGWAAPGPTVRRGLRAAVARLLSGTPGRMRLLAAAGVIAALALGGTAVNALLSSENAADRAATNTAQVVRVQSMQVDLLRADALATNAFLVGGLEPAEARKAYDDAIARVAAGLSQAAAAQPADGTALGELSTRVQTYTSLVEQARSNNRLGLPVGAQYLTQASASLRADAIPVIAEIVKANEQRAELEFTRSGSKDLLLVGVAAVIVLGLLGAWLARRTHRYLNRSLAAAIVLGIVVLFFSATQIGAMGNKAHDVAVGDYQQTVQLARIGTAANDARANESLTLIKRGSGADNEKAWKAQNTAVQQQLKPFTGLTDYWVRYRDAHVQVRLLDDNGRWDDAVTLATKVMTGGTTPLFGAFDARLASMRDTTSKAAISELRGIGGGTPWAIAVGLASLVAAWLVVRGFGQRIEEYR